jgi:SAM-dependent methyltransferase
VRGGSPLTDRRYGSAVGLDADLTAYYDAEARAGLRTTQAPMRVALRQRFIQLLRSEHRHLIIDVGAGPGLDTVGFQSEGFDAIAVDLAPANAAVMRDRGLVGVAGSLYALPFTDATFHALWTMSTFVHVPHDRFDDAITEMLRVVAPGAPLSIGTWGGQDFEGVPEHGELRPFRFFSLASHDRWRAMLAAHADVEQFETFPPTDPSGWEYQLAVLRRRG